MAFISSISRDGMQESLEYYTKTSRAAGSSADLEMANYIRDKAIEFGFTEDMIKTVDYDISLNTKAEMSLSRDSTPDVNLLDSSVFHKNSASGQATASIL